AHRKSGVLLSPRAAERADPDDDRYVDRGDERGECAVDQGLADDDVEVVQVEPEDRDADRHREHEIARRAEDGSNDRAAAGGDADNERDDRNGQPERDPLDLLPLDAARPPEPLDERENGESK